jgi:hypothetical protein
MHREKKVRLQQGTESVSWRWFRHYKSVPPYKKTAFNFSGIPAGHTGLHSHSLEPE